MNRINMKKIWKWFKKNWERKKFSFRLSLLHLNMKNLCQHRKLRVLRLIFEKQRLLFQECKRLWMKMLSNKKLLSKTKRKNWLREWNNCLSKLLKRKESLAICSIIKNKFHQKQNQKIKNFKNSRLNFQLKDLNSMKRLMN